MIIFYLQQEPYKLPSVSELQKSDTCDSVGQWNVEFVPVQLSNETLKTATIKDLVIGFFRFYATFDFYYNVIAPYYGSAINKVNFLKPFRLPPCYAWLVQLAPTMHMGSGTWVQDPFQHSKNITDSKNIVYVGKFSSLCRGVLQLEPSNEKQLLYRLMTQCNKYFLLDYHNGVEIVKEQAWDEQHWMQTIKNLMFTVLRNLLCCDIIRVDEQAVSSSTIQFVDKGRSAEIEQTTITCRGTREIWEDRISILKMMQAEIPSGCGCFNLDTFVSNVIRSDIERTYTFDLSVQLLFMRNPMGVKITVLDQNLLHFNHFLYTRMLEALETAERKEQMCNPSQVTAEVSPISVVCERYRILVKGKFEYAKIRRVHDYFSRFGKIVDVKVLGEEKKLAVEYCFAECDVFLKVIQKQHALFGHELTIIPLALLNTKIPKAKFEDPRLRVVHSILKCPTFEQQVNRLSKKVNAINEKIETKHKMIRDDFSSALASKFSSSELSSGVDIETGNLDVYIDVSTDKQSETLKIMSHLIFRSNTFCVVSLTSEANDTFIACEHAKTRMNCRLRIGNKLIASRRHLIKYYLSLDSKLPNFMLLLKFWADYYDVIDAEAFSESAVYLMAIFYLQQKPYKLPSVKDLQNVTNPDLFDGWNCAYARIPEFTSLALKAATISDLLVGFFRFYSNFDYVTYVISPFFGSPLRKVRFLKPYSLPKGFKQFRTHRKDLNLNSGVFIQDFFEHCLNLASSVSLDCMGAFTNLCRTSLQLINSEEKLPLYKLLVNVQRNIFEYPEFVIEKNDDRDDQEWIQTVKTLTMKILSDVLNYKLLAKPILGVASTSFECVGQNNVWDNRIKSMKTLATLSALRGIEKEVAVTTQVTIDFPEKVAWSLFLDLIFTKNPCSVKVVFKRKPECFMVYHVCHFLYSKLVRFLDGEDVEGCSDVAEVEECKSSTPPPCTEDDSINRNQKDDDNIPTSSEIKETVPIVIDLTDDDDVKKLPETSDISDIEIDVDSIDDTTDSLLEIRDVSESETGMDLIGDTDTYKLPEISDISDNEIEIDLTDDVTTDKQAEVSDISENELEIDANQPLEISDVSENEVSFEDTKKKSVEDANEGKDIACRERKSNTLDEEEEEDDVPSDFFDDFAKEDFLDGLDMVDVGDKKFDEDTKILKSDYLKECPIRSTFKNVSNDTKLLKAGSRQQARSRSKSRDRMYHRSTKLKSRSRSLGKTRDKRKRRSSSGSSERKDVNGRSKIITRTKIRSRTPSPYTKFWKRSASPQYYSRRRSSSRDRKKSSLTSTTMKLPQTSVTKMRSRTPPHELSRRKRSSSPKYRSRRRSLSGDDKRSSFHSTSTKTKLSQNFITKIKSRTPSPRLSRRRKSRSPQYRSRRRSSSRDTSRTTKMNSLTRIRSRSPSPHQSKRPKRSPEYRSRRRNSSRDASKSSSPHSTATKSELSRKCLLEEIKKKINEVRPVISSGSVINDLPMSNSTVQAVPVFHMSLPIPPSHSQQPVQVQIYDKNFFIGTPVQIQEPASAPYRPPEQIPPVMSLPVLAPLQEMVISSKTKHQAKHAEGYSSAKFFKKETLRSDYLTVGAIKEVPAPIGLKHVQEKAKVLSCCQKIIKFLTHDRRLIKPSPKPSPRQPKHQSPLKATLALRFKYTSPPKERVRDGYSEALAKVLEKGSIVKKVKVKSEEAIDKVTEALEALKKALSDAVDKR